MRRFKVLGVLGALCVAYATAAADTITVEGVTHEGVYIDEGASRWYVRVPGEGRTWSVAKQDAQVEIEADPKARKELLNTWRLNRLAEDPPAAEPEAAVPLPKPDAASAPRPASRASRAQDVPASPRVNAVVSPTSTDDDTETVTDGVITGYVRLEDVPLETALKAVLRPLNLDYRVEDGFIWISSPERLRRESFEELETRYYTVRPPYQGSATVAPIDGYGGAPYRNGRY